jgi:hypothetical protein
VLYLGYWNCLAFIKIRESAVFDSASRRFREPDNTST